MNEIRWAKLALKQLRKLDPQHAAQIVSAARKLEHMPAVANVKALANYRCAYRLRVGDYRVMFDWDGRVSIIEIREVTKRHESTY